MPVYIYINKYGKVDFLSINFVQNGYINVLGISMVCVIIHYAIINMLNIHNYQ